MPSHTSIARALAAAFLADSLEVEGLVDRGARLLGRRWRWLRPLARRVCEAFARPARPRQIDVVRFLLGDDGYLEAASQHELRLVDRLAAMPQMVPAGAACRWNVPTIRMPGELADWLGLSTRALDWFADRWTLESKRNQGRLRHYYYRPVAKRFGQIRLIEAPKQRLKKIQRQILDGILDPIPPHPAVHGFRRGRSIASFASCHTGRRVVLRIDLEDFFPSISVARIQALFRTVGYPENVADLLAGLCTNAAPAEIWDDVAGPSDPVPLRRHYWFYSRPHLPQGAPTSPALANLCAYRMDCRLARLAETAGAVYTRYADDLAFSGDREFERVVRRFQLHTCATVIEEGFAAHHRKTRIMRRGVRQRLAGLVVNKHLNVVRIDYDRLKATLTNCVRHGIESQNRSGHADFHGHLQGRVAFVESVNPHRGRRLRELFERIEW